MKKGIAILLGLILSVTMIIVIPMISCQSPNAAETTAAESDAGTSEEAADTDTAEDTAVVAGVEGECTDCHNNTTLVKSKQIQVEQSVHGSGANLQRNGANCAICHTSEGFTERIEAGTFELAEAVINPTSINCRTCHNIHETYTSDDWSLAVTDAVKLELTGDTYDKGNSNICASCHQPRIDYEIPQVGGADVEITSIRFGPHYGVQSSILLGVGGYGEYTGSNVHYDAVDNGCISCHMTDAGAFGKKAGGHTFKPSYETEENEEIVTVDYLAGCQKCHEDIETFDRNGVQTEVQAMFDELQGLLVAKGIIDSETHLAIEGTYTSEQAGALWNYRTVYGDRSLGVHNPGFTKFLLQTAIDALK